MTSQTPDRNLPDSYIRTLRTLIRFAIVLAILGLLVGVSYQESAHKLTYEAAPDGLRPLAVLPLALVHGHFFTLGVLLPLGLAGALVLALKTGARPVGSLTLGVLTRGVLPFAAASLALQLYKGYFILLSVRHGQHDLGAVDAAFLGGSATLRLVLYAVIHTALGVTLGIFLVSLWRSLGQAQVRRDA